MKLYFEQKININYYRNLYFVICLLLTIIGWVTIYSTTVCKSTPNYNFIIKQIVATTLGIIFCFSIAQINHQHFKKITYPLVGFTVVLLIIVLFMPEVKGSRRWIPLPLIGQFQPSELAKFTSILLTAKFLDKYRSKIATGKKEFWILVSIILLLCGLILLQKDLGIPAIIFISNCTLLFLSGVQLKNIIKLLAIVLPILIVAVVTQPHRINRIKMFFNTGNGTTNSYQIRQSIFAISRGGVLGCGLGKGVFKEYYIPEIHTDFIFCTIGEELGFLGSLIIIGLFLTVALLGFIISYNVYSTRGGFYGSMLVAGITLNIVIQAYLNLAVVTKLFLPKGIGLPFISYGGSSLVVNFLTLGVIFSVCNTINR